MNRVPFTRPASSSCIQFRHISTTRKMSPARPNSKTLIVSIWLLLVTIFQAISIAAAKIVASSPSKPSLASSNNLNQTNKLLNCVSSSQLSTPFAFQSFSKHTLAALYPCTKNYNDPLPSSSFGFGWKNSRLKTPKMTRKRFVYHENSKCPVSDEEFDLFDDRETEMESNQQPDCYGKRTDQSIAASKTIKNGLNNNQVSIESSRRTALFQLLALSTILSQQQFQQSANASPEIDSTGSLFSPKSEMISGGGSQAARGIPLKELDREDQRERNKLNKDLLKRKGLIQDVYETRFITYLARFLLVFDPAARAWWKVRYLFYCMSDFPFPYKITYILISEQ